MPWQNETLQINGRTYAYEVFRQLGPTCGPCAFVNFAYYTLGRRLSLAAAKFWLWQTRQAAAAADGEPIDDDSQYYLEGAYLPDTYKTLRRRFPQLPLFLVDFGAGAGVPIIVDLLANCTPATPALVSIGWTTSLHANHQTVCLGKPPGCSEIIFLDPDLGIVAFDYEPKTDGDMFYKAAKNSRGLPALRSRKLQARFFRSIFNQSVLN